MFLYCKVLYTIKYYNLHSKKKDCITWSRFLTVPYNKSLICKAHTPFRSSLGRNNLNVGIQSECPQVPQANQGIGAHVDLSTSDSKSPRVP